MRKTPKLWIYYLGILLIAIPTFTIAQSTTATVTVTVEVLPMQETPPVITPTIIEDGGSSSGSSSGGGGGGGGGSGGATRAMWIPPKPSAPEKKTLPTDSMVQKKDLTKPSASSFAQVCSLTNDTFDFTKNELNQSVTNLARRCLSENLWDPCRYLKKFDFSKDIKIRGKIYIAAQSCSKIKEKNSCEFIRNYGTGNIKRIKVRLESAYESCTNNTSTNIENAPIHLNALREQKRYLLNPQYLITRKQTKKIINDSPCLFLHYYDSSILPKIKFEIRSAKKKCSNELNVMEPKVFIEKFSKTKSKTLQKLTNKARREIRREISRNKRTIGSDPKTNNTILADFLIESAQTLFLDTFDISALQQPTTEDAVHFLITQEAMLDADAENLFENATDNHLSDIKKEKKQNIPTPSIISNPALTLLLIVIIGILSITLLMKHRRKK